MVTDAWSNTSRAHANELLVEKEKVAQTRPMWNHNVCTLLTPMLFSCAFWNMIASKLLGCFKICVLDGNFGYRLFKYVVEMCNLELNYRWFRHCEQ